MAIQRQTPDNEVQVKYVCQRGALFEHDPSEIGVRYRC